MTWGNRGPGGGARPGSDQSARDNANRPAEQPYHRARSRSGGRTACLTIGVRCSAARQANDRHRKYR
jgi:hypothetical protein